MKFQQGDKFVVKKQSSSLRVYERIFQDIGTVITITHISVQGSGIRYKPGLIGINDPWSCATIKAFKQLIQEGVIRPYPEVPTFNRYEDLIFD